MYAIVDIETTGGYADHHRITEIAIYHHDGVKITDHYQTLINPERNIPQFITSLTGINYEMVKEAPCFKEVAHEIYGQLKGRVFVAHNVHFDYSFLRKEFEGAGIQWSTKKLCTVRLSRKIIPGLGSYSLGRLAQGLGVSIEGRHRAGGDAQATAEIFDLLLKRDTSGVVAKALKRNSGETILPPNLAKSEFDKLPAEAGVYYFLNAKGLVIYVGKAINIKKRIAGHFTGEAREWNRSNIRNEIYHITYELTGNELIAFILESQEIRRLWPRYNLAQKQKAEEWGIYSYEDRMGYMRFAVNGLVRGAKPLITFSTKGEAWNFMWEKVKEYDLCPKLCGLQIAKGLCFSHQSGSCRGACLGIEKEKKYNKRAQRVIDTFFSQRPTVAIVGKGRSPEEKSVVLMENGNYLGYGFFDEKNTISSLEVARGFIQPAKDSRAIQHIVNAYIANPQGAEVVVF